jgi:hypothetical protein
MTSGADHKAQLLARIQRDPSPARPEVTRATALWSLGTVVVSGVIVALLGGAHAVRRSPSFVVATALAWGTVAAVATLLSLRRGRSMLGTTSAILAFVAALLPIVLAATWCIVAFGVTFEPAARDLGVDARCFAATLALAAAPLLLFFRQRSDGDPVRPTVLGAALGAAAGAWGSVLVDLHCDRVDVAHVAIGHVLPTIALAGIGALLGRRLLAVRADVA